MNTGIRVALFAALGGSSLLSQDMYSSCLAVTDLTVQIREEISAGVSDKRLKTIYSSLPLKTRSCPLAASSDLWFLRAKIAAKFGDTKEAESATEKAAELHSPLLAKKVDPFSAMVAAPVAEKPVTKLGKKYALLVGINKFKDERIPRLNFAANDAKLLNDALIQFAGFQAGNVSLLTDDKATLEGVRTGIGRLRTANPEDLVVIFLSSHGSPRNADPNGVSYIMMHDTNLEDGATRYATALQMIELVENLKRDVKAQRIVLLIDTCFSGDATGAKRIIPLGTGPSSTENAGWGNAPVSGAVAGLSSGTGRAVISASRADQESWESPAFKNGYFTHFLMEALKADKGMTPLGQIFKSVKNLTSEAVLKEKNASQIPQWQGTDTAETIVLGAPEGS